jgi:Rap1a immunity proteins
MPSSSVLQAHCTKLASDTNPHMEGTMPSLQYGCLPPKPAQLIKWLPENRGSHRIAKFKRVLLKRLSSTPARCRAAWEDQAAVGCHKSGHCSRAQKRGDKMRRFLLSMVLLSCGMGSGWCETITVEQLRVDCASASGGQAQTACAAYLMGMVHGLQIGTLFTKRRKPFCIPDSVKSPQAIQMFNKAAAERSEMGTEPADLLWIMTLSSAFPCAKSK